MSACSEFAKDEFQIADAVGLALDHRADNRKRPQNDARVRDAEQLRDQLIVQLGRIENFIQEYRPFLAQKLPCSDEVRAFFDKLDEVIGSKSDDSVRGPSLEGGAAGDGAISNFNRARSAGHQTAAGGDQRRRVHLQERGTMERCT